MKKYILISIISTAFFSCDNKAKVISPTETNNYSNGNGQSTGVFDNSNNKTDAVKTTMSDNSVHHIEVLEVLPTEKYVYLRVNEGEDEYWIATGKQAAEVGLKYFFRDGLLKTNFESKEYNRVFDKVYLVSKLVPENHSQVGKSSTEPANRIVKLEGSMSIKEVIEQASALEGKEVQLTGECTKLNANIMGRNWIHLKDGSKDDYDFVVTSDQAIPEGHIVTIKGIVSLNRDFGSGYRYDLLIENASLVRE